MYKRQVIEEAPVDLCDLKANFKYSEGSIPSGETFLTSLDDFDKDPSWLLGHEPNYGSGEIAKAPAILIVVDKGNGWVDAYWFYFYAFNLGPFIMGYGPWGNHVGDWEHTLVRFFQGEPQYLWMSAHSGGGYYEFSALEKKTWVQYSDDGTKSLSLIHILSPSPAPNPQIQALVDTLAPRTAHQYKLYHSKYIQWCRDNNLLRPTNAQHPTNCLLYTSRCV